LERSKKTIPGTYNYRINTPTKHWKGVKKPYPEPITTE
jgi:hypothetical protein